MQPFFLQPDPERQAELDAAHRKAVAAHHDEIDRLFEFLTNGSEGNLLVLNDVLNAIASDGQRAGGSISTANYYRGLCHYAMRTRFGLCVCGEDHGEELLKELGHHQVNPNDKRSTEQYLVDEGFVKRIASIEEENRQYLLNLVKYNMYRPTDADPGVVKCSNCQLQYPSLEDRMLRDVDDCHGCHLKASGG